MQDIKVSDLKEMQEIFKRITNQITKLLAKTWTKIIVNVLPINDEEKLKI